MDNHEEETNHAGGQSRAEGANLTDVLATSPSTGLGARLLEIRQRYIDAGGKLYTLDEINNEVSARRG